MSDPRAAATRRVVVRWSGAAGTAATLAILFWRLGIGPFLDGVRAVDGRALLAAATLTALTTLCSAWRWRVVARGIGVQLSLGTAVASYYRSQFLNLTLPGGILGDVHRGISHGRDVEDVGRGLRAVMWERFAGQLVQGVLTVAVLATMPSPVRSALPIVVPAILIVLIAAVALVRAHPGNGVSRWSRARGAAARDIRDGMVSGGAWLAIAAASTIVVVGHAATFIIAAHAAGVDASVATLAPLTLLAMLAMVLPSAAGIGPREGATAWAFAAAGLGADRGVATAVAYGVMTLVACLPGAGVLLANILRNARGAVAKVGPIAVPSDRGADG